MKVQAGQEVVEDLATTLIARGMVAHQRATTSQEKSHKTREKVTIEEKMGIMEANLRSGATMIKVKVEITAIGKGTARTV
jgi:hypothetical protein